MRTKKTKLGSHDSVSRCFLRIKLCPVSAKTLFVRLFSFNSYFSYTAFVAISKLSVPTVMNGTPHSSVGNKRYPQQGYVPANRDRMIDPDPHRAAKSGDRYRS